MCREGCSPLLAACWAGAGDVVAELLQEDCLLHMQDNVGILEYTNLPGLSCSVQEGWQPLVAACYCGHAGMAARILTTTASYWVLKKASDC